MIPVYHWRINLARTIKIFEACPSRIVDVNNSFYKYAFLRSKKVKHSKKVKTEEVLPVVEDNETESLSNSDDPLVFLLFIYLLNNLISVKMGHKFACSKYYQNIFLTFRVSEVEVLKKKRPSFKDNFLAYCEHEDNYRNTSPHVSESDSDTEPEVVPSTKTRE